MSPTYFSEPIIEIDGQAVPDLLEDILKVEVEESLHLPCMFSIHIKNDYFSGDSDDEAWKYQSLLEMGKTIKIGFKSSATASQGFDDTKKGYLVTGEVTGIETQFTADSQAPIVIRGYDASHRLHRGRQSYSFQNYTDTDIVKNIANKVKIKSGEIEDTGTPHDYVFQSNQTHMEFLRERAARNGFELFVQDEKLHFRKPKVDDTLELVWLKDISTFQIRVTSAEQVKAVEVRGWDYSKKKGIVSNQTKEKILTETDYQSGQKSASLFNVSSPTMVVVDQPVFSNKESDTMAQALLDELGGEFVIADAIAEGNPEIRPGKVIKVSGMGKYSGKYYITETRHRFQGRVYCTEFVIRGLRNGDLLSVLAPQNHLKVGQTLIVGIVTNNNDPKGWGRVRVKFPTLTEEHESNWARIVTVGAGPNRGLDCLPEIDDEVLVGFEHGDIHRPYIVGSVWNGNDKPPEAIANSVVDGKVRLRTLKTRTGHTLQFVEEDKGASKKGIYLDSVYGHHLYLNDSDKCIELKTNGGHFAQFDDTGKKLEIKTSGGHQILMNESGAAKIDMVSTGDINMKSGRSGSSNKISLNAGEISLTATTKITLKVGSSLLELSNSGVVIQGLQATLKGSTLAKVEGGLVNLEASGINSLKGSIVKIN